MKHRFRKIIDLLYVVDVIPDTRVVLSNVLPRADVRDARRAGQVQQQALGLPLAQPRQDGLHRAQMVAVSSVEDNVRFFRRVGDEG